MTGARIVFLLLFYLQFSYQVSDSATNSVETTDDNTGYGVFLDASVASKHDGEFDYTTSIVWQCEDDFDCTASFSSCINRLCQCPPGYVYSDDMTSCLKVATMYGDPCTESIQCSRYLFGGGICMNEICVCAEGYYYMHGRCYAYSDLFGECKKDVDCYVTGDFEATSCIDGVCRCSPGYYQREYRSCRPEAKVVGDKCMIANDCRFNSTAECNFDNECAFPEDDDSQSRALYNSDDTFQQIDLLQAQINATENCTVDKDCENYGAAFCGADHVCICKRAHFFVPELNKCVPEIGEPCDPKDDIAIEYSECRNGRWSCEIYRIVSEDNRNCLKAIDTYQNSCQRDLQCYVFGPDAICKNRECVCNEKSWFDENELFCRIKNRVDEECYQNVDCYSDDPTIKLNCINNVCSCPNGTEPNSNRTDCVRSSAAIGDKCEVNQNCIAENAECVNKICTCKANYYKLNDQCVSGINSTCTSNDNCAPVNTECQSNICGCKEDYVATSIDSCKPVSSFGKPCDQDIQCYSKTANSFCSAKNNSTDGLVCDCVEGYHYNFGRCQKRKVLGEECDNLGECYLDSNQDRVVCRNGVCACDWDYVQINKTVCGTPEQRGANGTSMINNSTWLLALLLLLTHCLKQFE